MPENETAQDIWASRPPRTAVWRVIAGVLVGAEGLIVAGITVWLVISLFTAPAESLISAAALMVLVAVGAVGVCAMSIGIFREQRWARSGGVVVQILVLAVALGAATDQFANTSLGLAIGLPALVTFVFIIAEVRSVGRADAAVEAAARAAAGEDGEIDKDEAPRR